MKLHYKGPIKRRGLITKKEKKFRKKRKLLGKRVADWNLPMDKERKATAREFCLYTDRVKVKIMTIKRMMTVMMTKETMTV